MLKLSRVSPHVETVVLLSKGVVDKDNFRKVEVDFSLEDMDLTELRGKATYAQVKEYILNELGLKQRMEEGHSCFRRVV